MRVPVYLDYQATTPLDPHVLEQMQPYLTEHFGNAASRSHAFGWRAEAAVEKARAQVAGLLGASDKEIVFTSGATEADNLAIKGVVEAAADRGDHVVTVKTEHKAVLDPCKHLERQRADRREAVQQAWPQAPLDEVARHLGGARVTYLGVGPDGRLDPAELAAALTEQTVLVSVMLANNEVGTLQPVDVIGRLCRERGVTFHCDAAQGVGKVPFSVDQVEVDLVSLSAHKLYGPKGVGALYVRRKPRTRLVAQMDGGGHERALRSGTLNVASIVGFGEACELARRERDAEAARVLGLRERLRETFESQLPGVFVNGSLEHRLPGNLNVSFAGVDADALMSAVRDVAVSSGSACMSATLEPSYVLRALGIPQDRATGSIRFGIGRFTTKEEVDFAAGRFVEAVQRLRAMNPAQPT
jgi:cysteine desulfurase